MGYGKTLSKGVKGDVRNTANIRHLTRIITYLSEIDKDHITGISEKTGVSRRILKGALLFLVNHGLVLKKKDLRKTSNRIWGDLWYYSLNKKNNNTKEQVKGGN